ncbi:HAD-superfamily subfamily IIID h [Testicularia cyperi]|uniref:protein-serine/threonine phosphatase n=1 Tax=Testicularia cyperi TaxID=1882483 RepID=A0A317XLM7_9BASI|nr:HAD-superfamily subfamily IIID h [Testicularia cyperi]
MTDLPPAKKPTLHIIEDAQPATNGASTSSGPQFEASASSSSPSSSSSSSGLSLATFELKRDVVAESSSQSFIGFSIKYSGSILSLRLSEDDSVADLKAILFSMTDVPPESQKLLGMVKGRQPADEIPLGEIPYAPAALRGRPGAAASTDKSSSTLAQTEAVCTRQVLFTLLGTPEAARFKDVAGEATLAGDMGEVNRDIDYLSQETVKEVRVHPSKDSKNLAKLAKVIDRFSDFSVIHPPRPGKRLLVLDLDYTIADTKRLLDPHSPASASARPGLHELLGAVWPHYDICVWSQTSWRWLEVKLVELNMLAHEDYKISFVLDQTPMFSVQTKERKHEVKPLELIWRRWPSIYGPHNTIHIDDLSRNFAMNPKNGLKIRPYKNSPNFDTEFVRLRHYLLQLAHSSVNDFTTLDHGAWKHFQGPEA